MRKRAYRSGPATINEWTRSRPVAQRAAAPQPRGSSLPFDFGEIAITTPGDPAERQAADAAASLAPPAIPQRGTHDENRTDTIAASLAPGSIGQPLSPAVREPFERRLGHQFGHVRIHADVTAESSARSLRARAYTIGRHVMFDAGRYAPETPDGRRLLAHELTHVAQADSGAAPMISRDDADADPKKIVAGQTTDKLVSDDVAGVLDALIAASRVLAPYIDKSKVRAIKGSITMLDTARFSTEYHNEKGDHPSYKGSEKDPDIEKVKGITQKNAPHKILLRQQISNFGDALHEAIHRISLPAFSTIAPSMNEGAADYFTRRVLAEARLDPPTNNYGRQLKSIEQLIDLVGEPVVGHAFFDVSKVKDLGNAMGTGLWLKWTLAMGKDDFNNADALIVREKLRRQLQRQIDEGKKGR